MPRNGAQFRSNRQYMSKIQKGNLTRNSILENARKVFNEKGILLTLDTIATEIGINKARVTNHFPTKEKLFGAIAVEYEESLMRLLSAIFEKYQSYKLTDIAETLSYIMDLQYEYRCSFFYLILYQIGDTNLQQYTNDKTIEKKNMIRKRIMNMVKHGVMDPEVMTENNWKSFLFLYINQMSNWVINLNFYDISEGYQKMKPIYMLGILKHVYGPYLTEKGRSELNTLNFNKIARLKLPVT